MQDLLGFVKSFPKEHPELIALGAVVLAAAAVAFKWLKARRAAKKVDAGKGEVAAAAKVAPPKMPANKLSRIWKQFLGELPAVFRRSILNFQPFIVLGAAGSGKSRLVDSYTDWRRQARQFLGSATDDPDLQIYLGSQVLAMEVASAILHETSSAARRALIKLWRPVLRGRTPIVVVAVDLAALQDTSPDASRALADTIHGKISLLSWMTRKPVEVRVALTHLDRVEGYAEVAKFFDRQRVNAALELSEGDAGSAQTLQERLAQKFAEMERLLPLALTTLSSAEYMRVVVFFREIPKYLPKLGTFLAALCSPDALSKRPRLERVYLTSEEHEENATNPFHAPLDSSRDRGRNPLLRHQLAASALAAAGVAYLLTGYWMERREWEATRGAVREYSASIPREREQALRRKLTRFTHRSERDPALDLFPSFFGRAEEATKAGLSDSIRRQLLRNGLEDSFVSDHPEGRSLYFLSLLYATADNELGLMINPPALETETATSGQAFEEAKEKKGRLDEWAAATGLDRELVRDYVESSGGYEGRVSLLGLPDRITPGPTNSGRPWALFLRAVQDAKDRPFVTADEYASLQDQARVLLEALHVVRMFRHMPQILTALEVETGYDFAASYQYAREEIEFSRVLGHRTGHIERLLHLVASERVAPLDEPPQLLADLCAELEVILHVPADESREIFAVDLAGERFSLPAKEWTMLVRNSAARERLLAFVRHGQENPDSLFFSDGDKFQSISMNPRNDGTYLFTGKATLDGRYTRAAFDKNVRPAVESIVSLLDRIQLGADERANVERFVTQEVEWYSGHYEKAIDEYYASFGTRAESASSVLVLLEQMRTGSAFADLLNVMFTNTKLDIDEKNVLLQPMAEAMQKYAPLVKLMPDETGKDPELSKYRDTLKQIEVSLSGVPSKEKKQPDEKAEGAKPAEPAAPAKSASSAEEGASPGLADVLPPAGRLTLATLNGAPGSHREMITTWLASVDLEGELGRPFLEPVDQLYGVGLGDIEAKIDEIWRGPMTAVLSRARVRFPFDRDEAEELSPAEMEELFHPLLGRFHDLRRRFIDPISLTAEREGDRTISPMRGLDVPRGMYEMINKINRLTHELWDEKGKPKSMHLEVSSVPFESAKDSKWYLTLVYLESGSATLVNFNQQPFPKAFELDWTKPSRARIGVELSTADGEKLYPSALVAPVSHWSFLRLLARGEQRGTLWTWRVPYGRGKEPSVGVQFSIATDPRVFFDIFPNNNKVANRDAASSTR